MRNKCNQNKTKRWEKVWKYKKKCQNSLKIHSKITQKNLFHCVWLHWSFENRTPTNKELFLGCFSFLKSKYQSSLFRGLFNIFKYYAWIGMIQWQMWVYNSNPKRATDKFPTILYIFQRDPMKKCMKIGTKMVQNGQNYLTWSKNGAKMDQKWT